MPFTYIKVVYYNQLHKKNKSHHLQPVSVEVIPENGLLK